IAGTLGALAAAMGKIAQDLVLLSQTEVAEVTTGAGETKGRSSAMPQKRNPTEAAAAAACARLAIAQVPVILAAGIQEHERAAGAWQAEWEAVPQLFRLTAGAVEWVHRALVALRVDAARMRSNLRAAGGMIMAEALMTALAPRVGRPAAYGIVRRVADRVAETGQSFAEAAHADAEIRAALSPQQIAAALDPAGHLGSAGAIIDRALASFRALPPEGGR
ncbi:MAG TPA: lyase family protein, partial [bacterium]|nr:lyase family protein [bacterium]